MRIRRAPVVGALCLLAVAASPPGGRAAAPPAEPQVARASEPGDVCNNGSTLYYWTLDDRFTGNESYRVLCEPAGCADCAGGWKPLSVTMYLYWEESNSCALTVQAELRAADPNGPDPPRAGRVLVSSDVVTVGPFRPAGLWAVTVALPPDSPVIEGPCFASIRFLDTCDELPDLVAAPGDCEPMRTWNRRGAEWIDMRDLDMPGNLSAFASFECQYADATEPATWTAIKGIYEARRQDGE